MAEVGESKQRQRTKQGLELEREKMRRAIIRIQNRLLRVESSELVDGSWAGRYGAPRSRWSCLQALWSPERWSSETCEAFWHALDVQSVNPMPKTSSLVLRPKSRELMGLKPIERLPGLDDEINLLNFYLVATRKTGAPFWGGGSWEPSALFYLYPWGCRFRISA